MLLLLFDQITEIVKRTSDIIDDVSFNHQVMYTMHCDRSVETTVYRTALHIAFADVSFDMEMDGVATEAERLARVCHFNVVEMCNSKSLW